MRTYLMLGWKVWLTLMLAGELVGFEVSVDEIEWTDNKYGHQN